MNSQKLLYGFIYCENSLFRTFYPALEQSTILDDASCERKSVENNEQFYY